MTSLTLIPVEEKDMQMIAVWLDKEHVKPWFENPEDWLAEIKLRDTEFSWIQHYIIIAGKTPIGFCQYYDCYDANDFEGWYQVEEPGKTFSIDYCIGETDYLYKGYGKAVVAALTEQVRSETKGIRIIVQPDQENVSSQRVLTANGYIYSQEEGFYIKNLN